MTKNFKRTTGEWVEALRARGCQALEERADADEIATFLEVMAAQLSAVDRECVPISDDLSSVFVDGPGSVSLDYNDERLTRATKAEAEVARLVAIIQEEAAWHGERYVEYAEASRMANAEGDAAAAEALGSAANDHRDCADALRAAIVTKASDQTGDVVQEGVAHHGSH